MTILLGGGGGGVVLRVDTSINDLVLHFSNAYILVVTCQKAFKFGTWVLFNYESLYHHVECIVLVSCEANRDRNQLSVEFFG